MYKTKRLKPEERQFEGNITQLFVHAANAP